MTKGMLATIGILGLMFASASASGASAQTYSFTGAALITARSGADCDSVNVQVNELHTMVYRPVQDGIGSAAIQVLTNQSAHRFAPNGGGDFILTAGNHVYTATAFTGRAGLQTYNGTYRQLKIRPAPTATTPLIDITGRITNFRNAGNCTVDFAAGLVLRPAN